MSKPGGSRFANSLNWLSVSITGILLQQKNGFTHRSRACAADIHSIPRG